MNQSFLFPKNNIPQQFNIQKNINNFQQSVNNNNNFQQSVNNNNNFQQSVNNNNNFQQSVNNNLTGGGNFNNDNVSEYSDEEEEDEQEEQEIDPIVFTDSNPEFVKFKSHVKEWVSLDDDIKTLQDAIKKRKKMMNDITPQILDFMKRFNINDLNTQNGQLRYTTSLLSKPVNKNFLLAKLGDFFKDNEKGEKITSYLFENRDKQEKIKLTRVIKKNKLDI
jgi:hypothetical protein